MYYNIYIYIFVCDTLVVRIGFQWDFHEVQPKLETSPSDMGFPPAIQKSYNRSLWKPGLPVREMIHFHRGSSISKLVCWRLVGSRDLGGLEWDTQCTTTIPGTNHDWRLLEIGHVQFIYRNLRWFYVFLGLAS